MKRKLIYKFGWALIISLVLAISALPCMPALGMDTVVIVGNGTPMIYVEVSPSGGGTVPSQVLNSGNSITAYAIMRDQNNQFIMNVGATWSLAYKTGNVQNSDLVPAVDGKSATFTGHLAGVAVIQASMPGAVSVVSGLITVKESTPTGSGETVAGGGGGGAGGSVTGTASLVEKQTVAGELLENVSVTTEGSLASLDIPRGTTCRNAWGSTLSWVQIQPIDDPSWLPALPEGAVAVGFMYSLGPKGASFNPPVIFTSRYNPELIPAEMDETNLLMATLDISWKQWLIVDGVIDKENSIICAPISSFTVCIAIAMPRQAAISVTDLSPESSTIYTGDEAVVRALLRNTGDIDGYYSAVLNVDNSMREIREILVPGKQELMIQFYVTGLAQGAHEIAMESLTGHVMVLDREAPLSSSLTLPTQSDGTAEIANNDAIIPIEDLQPQILTPAQVTPDHLVMPEQQVNWRWLIYVGGGLIFALLLMYLAFGRY